MLSLLFVRDTEGHVAREVAVRNGGSSDRALTARDVFWRTSVADRNLSSVCQAGLVNNLNDGMAWGLFPLVFAAAGMNLGQIGTLAAIYPATWGVAQLATGALSDRVGRKPLITSGMWVQAVGIGVIAVAQSGWGFATGSVLLGLGTAMVYPTLLAAIGDVASPAWRASSDRRVPLVAGFGICRRRDADRRDRGSARCVGGPVAGRRPDGFVRVDRRLANDGDES